MSDLQLDMVVNGNSAAALARDEDFAESPEASLPAIERSIELCVVASTMASVTVSKRTTGCDAQFCLLLPLDWYWFRGTRH